MGLLVVEEVRAERGTFEEKLEVGSQEKPEGITVYDKLGKPACILVEDTESGIVKTTPGECGLDF